MNLPTGAPLRFQGSASAPLARLGMNHFSYLRSIAQGLDSVDSARRYLGVSHRAAVPRAHARVVDTARVLARRAGLRDWRLVGVRIGAGAAAADAAGAPPAAPVAPPLEQWIVEQGLEDWSQRDQLQFYAEAFPVAARPEPARRRLERNARLMGRQLELLRRLETAVAERPNDGHAIADWFDPAIAARLRTLGDVTLGDLRARLAVGGCWWESLRGIGPTKARRVEAHLAQLLGTTALLPAMPAWSPALVRAGTLSRLTGQGGANRARGELGAGLDADDDRAAIRAWIAARAGSPVTARQYEREAERFLLWCLIERARPLSGATAEDCRAYMDFLRAVPATWISRRRAPRLAPGWAPFRGPLTIASQQIAITIVHALCDWLVRAGYLQRNPWVLVHRQLGDDAERDDDVTSRAFTPAAWAVLVAHVQARAPSPSTSRLQWLCAFVSRTGLRSAELLRAQRGHLRRHRGGWVLRVHGKGRKNRLVPVPGPAMEATRKYFAERGLDFDTAPAETPLLASTLDPRAPLAYTSLYETFTRFVRRAVKTSALPLDERQHALRASAHWLRHTYATRAAESGEVPLDVLQETLGQAHPRTTSAYYRAQIERRQKALEAAFGSDRLG